MGSSSGDKQQCHDVDNLEFRISFREAVLTVNCLKSVKDWMLVNRLKDLSGVLLGYQDINICVI